MSGGGSADFGGMQQKWGQMRPHQQYPMAQSNSQIMWGQGPQPNPGSYGPQPTGPMNPTPVQMGKGTPQPTYGATTNSMLGQTNMYQPNDGWDPPGSFDPGYGQPTAAMGLKGFGTPPGANLPQPTYQPPGLFMGGRGPTTVPWDQWMATQQGYKG